MTQEQVIFWRDAVLADMEVLRARYVTHAFTRHSHEEYAIGVIESGIEAFDYLGSTYQAPAGTLVIIHPGEVHTGQAGDKEGWQYRMTYPSVELMQKAVVGLGRSPSEVPFFPTPLVTDPDLVGQFRRFHRSLEQGVSPLERESRMLWLLAHLIHRYGELRSPLSPLPHNQTAIQTVESFLRAHYSETISLEDLATLVDLSPLKLLRLCKKNWGLPPHRYLVQIRVQQAKRFIAAGLPLSEVAAITGFADQSHLNRHFKRLIGVTPGQYQRGC